MLSKVPVALAATALLLAAIQVPAQEAAQPLQSMPYSPSLDLSSLDRGADPCVDFYKFSCGGWEKKNPIPPDQSGWSVYAKLGNENEQFLWGILEADAKAANRDAVQQKVGDYFAACMNTSAIDALGVKPALSGLARIDALKTRPELVRAISSLHHDYAGSFLFESGTDQDAIDSSLEIVALGAGGLGLPDRDYYLKTDDKSVKLRERYLAYIQKLLTLGGESANQAKLDADATLHIETALAKASLTRVDRRDPHKTYHMMTISELSKIAPAFDWPSYFEIQGAPGVAKLNVAQPEFMKAVQTEVSTESVEALRGYLRFHFLTAAAPYLARPLEQTDFDFYSTTLRGVPAMPPRWKSCTRGVDRDLGEALGQEFVKRTFSADTKAKTQLMTEQIEAAMKQEIENLDWMSPATKQEALRKLHVIRNKIGYPNQWRDYTTLEIKSDDYIGNVERSYRFEDARQWHKLGKPVDLNEWGMTPPTVNAYFNPQMNDINFPAGVLQPPLYDTKLDDAPNYGNTGATIGHELTHAFDDEGRQYDDKGNLRDWWTPADAKGFEDRINCIRDQYAQYIVVDDIHINSKLTSGEDVADLGGTLIAYIAWKRQTAGQQLASSDGFTPDQRFFVGMAQWACENERPEVLRVRAITDPHSPGYARINGVVSNMPEFQRAFSCKAGQPMVHAPACKVW
ncbi:M13 family metallopeptidase [Tunturiibacter gelidoferens]|uniref:Endothelin-converting enzyme/putative endopeptidase n=1 Tax=Tunturiibacter gelidiferens TaxID=3069689 RepID=A0ACC5P3N1_9BACT|nr:M13 family metallopeptidase [Edaphobacter lichenicola]MBB5341330.1 endothelin-converting enzyme/putative endopeptidase [Edaphobacter lichenicola]